MQTPHHHRKIELQSTADLAYLYTNTISLSRQKLDLHFPPSANDSSTSTSADSDSDPMKARVRELVDEFITKTYTTALPSLSINGLDFSTDSHSGLQTLLSTTARKEEIEYEPYDARLAARVAGLYAQLEALNTAVAQMRRDVPRKAAGVVGGRLGEVITAEQEGEEEGEGEGDVKIGKEEEEDGELGVGSEELRAVLERHPEWVLRVPFGTEEEGERWTGGEMREVYGDALRRLVRLQGDGGEGSKEEDEGDGSSSLAATVGKVERARLAAEVVEKI